MWGSGLNKARTIVKSLPPVVWQAADLLVMNGHMTMDVIDYNSAILF